MVRHPTSRRVHRDQTDPEDAFISSTLELTVWAKRNSRSLVIAAIVLALLAAGVVYYISYQRTLRVQAANRLTEIRQTVGSGNLPLATRDLEEYLNRFAGAPASEEARLLLAEIYIQEGQVDQVPPLLRELADDLREPMGPPAAFLVAAAYEQADQLDQAEDVYLRIAADAPYDFQRNEALDDAARLRMQQGDYAGASQLYDRLLASLEDDDPQRSIYQMWLAEARASMSGGTAVSEG